LKVPELYHFVTDWTFRAPLEKVWSVVLDIEHYAGRWKNFRRVQVLSGDGRSVGSRIECTVRGSLPYSLTYTLEVVESEKYRHVLMRSTGGLVGTGRWAFSESAPGLSKAVFYWDVATTTHPQPGGAAGQERARPESRPGNGERLCGPSANRRGLSSLGWAMKFEDDFAQRHPNGVEKRGGSTFIAVEIAGDFIAEADRRGIGIIGMDGFLISEYTYPALGRIADFAIDGNDSPPGFVAWSCRRARALLAGPWASPPTPALDQMKPEAVGRYMIDFTLTDTSSR
jgi:hypothetical protein